MPKVSVIIPAFNADSYITQAIQSVLDQTLRDFELIIIDDASKDETWPIIKQFAEKDSRIRAYRNDVNLGITGNRNRGLELATGQYIAWQDADDISLPTRLDKQCAYLDANSEVGIVGGFLELFRNNVVIGVRKYPIQDKELRRCIFRYAPVAQPSAMLRVEALNQVGRYDERYATAEDLDMTFRIGEKYKLGNIGEVLVRYRESGTSDTFRNLRKMEKSTIHIRLRHFDSASYPLTFGDVIYNALHFISIWLIPPKLKIKLFRMLRDSNAKQATNSIHTSN
jgi:glycosyltransferase involved in cell wall biosynthesis